MPYLRTAERPCSEGTSRSRRRRGTGIGECAREWVGECVSSKRSSGSVRHHWSLSCLPVCAHVCARCATLKPEYDAACTESEEGRAAAAAELERKIKIILEAQAKATRLEDEAKDDIIAIFSKSTKQAQATEATIEACFTIIRALESQLQAAEAAGDFVACKETQQQIDAELRPIDDQHAKAATDLRERVRAQRVAAVEEQMSARAYAAHAQPTPFAAIRPQKVLAAGIAVADPALRRPFLAMAPMLLFGSAASGTPE